MSAKEFNVQGIKLTIIAKPAFEMIGYKTPANLGDGSIARLIAQLSESGKMAKLAGTLHSPQQVWVCLSDCLSCGVNCSGFHVCCRVCVEKTENHDFSKFADDELSVLRLPASEWVLYESDIERASEILHKNDGGVYDLKNFGYKRNDNISLHFDNEHECYNNGEWISGKTFYFLLPVVQM